MKRNERGPSRAQAVSSKPRALPDQSPYKRTYPSGRFVWVARYLDLDGKAHYAKPSWNGGKSSFLLRREAQQAINEALRELPGAPERRHFW
jgi:hypothetical protein